MARIEWPEGQRMAAEIIKRYPDLFRHIPPLNDILFVLDDETTPTSHGNIVGARVSRIQGKFVDFIDAGNKLWMLETFKLNTMSWDAPRLHLLMAHELLHFAPADMAGEYKLRGHDIDEFHVIADLFGTRWTDLNRGDIPDILDPSFKWGLRGQGRLDFSGHVEEIARGVAGAVPGTEVEISAGGKTSIAKAIEKLRDDGVTH